MDSVFDDLDLFAETAAGDVRDPYPAFAEARKAGVIEREHYYVSTHMIYRYDDVVSVLKDPQTYSSAVYAKSMGLVMGPTILQQDAQDHFVHRGLIASAFRRKALESWEQTLIYPTVNALVDRFAGQGSAELVRDLTIRYPIRIIAQLLGIPEGQSDHFARLSIELISITVDIQRGFAASQSLHDLFAELLRQRRVDPADDLISTLATAEAGGRRLDDEAIFGFLRLLLPAGAETTYRLLGTLLFALLSNPDDLDAVREDRALIAPAIEEALRWESPVQYVSRTPTRDVVVAGTTLPAGASVTLALGSANRDETHFGDPDSFDIRRKDNDHVAFAEGPHRCLGEHLARLEVTAAVNVLLDRLGDLRLDPGDADPHVHGSAFRSPTSLPVAFTSSKG